jgi:thiamine biosynthesis protein ThiS
MITINSKRIEGYENSKLSDLLRDKNLLLPGVIVVVNGKLIHKDRYDEIKVSRTEKIVITHVMGGG